MVQNSEWGPHLWKILHKCAEKCGKQTIQMLHEDEIRAFIHLLQIVDAILPCTLCEKHYREWRMKRPPAFLGKTPAEFHEAATHWVWELHNHVNQMRGLAIMPFSEDFGTKDLQESLKTLMEVLHRARLQRLISADSIREWSYRLKRFLTVCGS